MCMRIKHVWSLKIPEDGACTLELELQKVVNTIYVPGTKPGSSGTQLIFVWFFRDKVSL